MEQRSAVPGENSAAQCSALGVLRLLGAGAAESGERRPLRHHPRIVVGEYLRVPRDAVARQMGKGKVSQVRIGARDR